MTPIEQARRLVHVWRSYANLLEEDADKTADVRRALNMRVRAQAYRECARETEVLVLGAPIEPQVPGVTRLTLVK